MKILHLPLWIPNKHNVQLGNFIQQQIELSSVDNETFTLGFISDRTIKRINVISNANSLTISYPSSNNKFISLFNYLKAVKISIQEFQKFNFSPHIVHCHVAGRNLWLAQKYFKGIPIIISEHWSGYISGEFKKQSFFLRKYLIKKINKCQCIISVSNHLTKALTEEGVKLKIKQIGNVIDVKEKHILGDSNEMNFFVIADLEDQVKNISGILNAFQLISSSYPKFKLNIVGDGTDSFKLKQRSISLKINENVNFLGRVTQNEVQNLLTKADCVIVNSNYETFSMITLESILTGCPVIATKCGGPEQFINKNNGLLIEKNNTAELANAMQYIFKKKTSYSPDKVRNSITEKYSKDQIRKELNLVYNSISPSS